MHAGLGTGITGPATRSLFSPPHMKEYGAKNTPLVAGRVIHVLKPA